MKKPNTGPNPFQEFRTFVVLTACFYMAVEGLVYQAFIASLIPANASFSWSALFDSGSSSTQPTRTYGK